MVSLRLPFSSFPQPPRRPRKPNSSRTTFRAAMAAAAAGIGVGIAISLKMANPAGQVLPRPSSGASPIWASLSLSDSAAAGTSVEPKTGVEFPNVIDGTRRLLGVGLRKKSLFGLKNIDVYAFGVYADANDVKKLKEKYGTLTMSQLKESKEFNADILEQDLRMTVRLQIVYSRLSIRSVRSAFEESVGSRLQKYSGSDNRELLQRFTSLFKDEYKLPRGSTIDLSREHGYVLHTRIDGKEVGSIQSKLLCQSILDLYIGDDPFDKRAKEDIGLVKDILKVHAHSGEDVVHAGQLQWHGKWWVTAAIWHAWGEAAHGSGSTIRQCSAGNSNGGSITAWASQHLASHPQPQRSTSRDVDHL